MGIALAQITEQTHSADPLLTAEDVAERLKVSRDILVLGGSEPVLCANPCIDLGTLTSLSSAQTET
jgi:hypothetical protein